MTSRVQLTSMVPAPGGGARSVSRSYVVGGVEYEVPLALQMLDGDVAIAPTLLPGDDGDTLVIRLDGWEVLHLGVGRRLPLLLTDMATAARVARDFGADPGISWHSDPSDIEAWAVTWLDRERSGDEE